jgi:hypothetical protein
MSARASCMQKAVDGALPRDPIPTCSKVSYMRKAAWLKIAKRAAESAEHEQARTVMARSANNLIEADLNPIGLSGTHWYVGAGLAQPICWAQSTAPSSKFFLSVISEIF